MGGAQIGTDALNSLIGKTEGAYLVIDDMRELCDAPPPQTGGTGAAGALSAATDAAKKGAAAALSGNAAASDAGQKKSRYFKVQFNPSELQLNASTAYESVQDAQAKNKDRPTTTEAPAKPSITLSVNLLFDAFNYADALMGEKYTSGLSATTVTSAVSGGLMAKGHKFTVQDKVEGILAALRGSYTRNVSFHWADFAFTGQLTAVSAQYTMFSTSGRPIRAQVSLRIFQELDPEKVSDWYASFSEAFGTNGLNLTNVGQKMGNLLNVNL